MRLLLVLARAQRLGLRRGAPPPQTRWPLQLPPQLAPDRHHVPVQLHLQQELPRCAVDTGWTSREERA